MLTQNRAMSWFLTSRALTAAIVASVIFINFVAWGIPLLVGLGHSRPAHDGTDIKTGSVARPDWPATGRRGRVTKTVLQVQRALIPLPDQAPEQLSLQGLRKSALHKIGRAQSLPPPPTMLALPSRPWQSKQPITLFPRPEAAPELVQSASLATTTDGAIAPLRGFTRTRNSVRDIVLVSPYTPGVRVAPDGRGHEWRHRNVRTPTGATTLDKAKAIARRAARRFEQMRDRMAGLDARGAAAGGEERARSRALMPVASRPPRIVDGAVGRYASKSAYNYVRARLIRRSIGHVGTPPSDIPTMQAARVSARPDVNTPHSAGDTRPNPAVKVSQPKRIARLTPKETARSRRRRARARGAAVLRKQRQASRRRGARRRETRRHRSTRKINGFRSDFHRQLVAANFFGNAQ